MTSELNRPGSATMAPLEVTPDDITLVTSLEDPSVDIEAVLLAWEDLHPYSVDAVTTQHSELFDFAASDQCMLFACIQLKVTEAIPADEYAKKTREQDKGPQTNAEPSELEVRTTTTIHTIGLLYLHKTEMPTEYNVGISIHPEWRGQGLAEKVLTKGVAYAFDNLWAHRVQALTMDSPWSNATRGVFISLGFTFEGTRRRAIVSPTVAGGYRDIASMAMLDTEWHVRAHGEHGPRGVWDEMFERHHKEQESLLKWEERRRRLHRTDSMETVREGLAELALTSGAPSPTASSVDLTDSYHPPPGLPDPRTRAPKPDADIDDPLSIPPSPISSTASWSDLDQASQSSSPLLKKRRKKGKRSAASGGSHHDHGHSSDASCGSGWDVV